mgnify:CR=1 FL=1
MNYKKQINKVIARINSLGVDVNLQSNTFAYYQEDNLITCHWKAQELDVLCSLLHELGHVVQPKSTFNDFRKSKRRDQTIIAEQEYTAWQLGWEEAVALNINTPELYTYYRKMWMKCWSGYLDALFSKTQLEAEELITYLIDTYKSDESRVEEEEI